MIDRSGGIELSSNTYLMLILALQVVLPEPSAGHRQPDFDLAKKPIEIKTRIVN